MGRNVFIYGYGSRPNWRTILILQASASHDQVLRNLVERYAADGYRVVKEPGPDDVPFDLGGYRPDLVAEKDAKGLIIEVKTKLPGVSFEQLRSIASEVRRHPGWRFLLVTSEDVEDGQLPGPTDEKQPVSDVEQALADAATASHTSATLAFMRLWVAFERMMRFQARHITLPVDRISAPKIILGQLYSLGELSPTQFDKASSLLLIRNRVFHGLDVSDLVDHTAQLSQLILELRSEWLGQGEEAEVKCPA